MSAPVSIATAIRLVCPGCGRFLVTVEGTSVECPPCSCGLQTTVKVTGKRLERCRRPVPFDKQHAIG
jgi:hypothetical protein